MGSQFLAYIKGHESVPGEAKLLRKLDFFILTFCCLCFFANFLDRSNLTNAYVSGMREELNFKSNEINVIGTIFAVGFILGQVPSNLAMTYIPPRIFMPAMIVLWGGLTMVAAAVKKPQDLMAIRFFLGVAESSTFIGTHYILGSWYTEKELGKRSGIFTASGLAGQMFGGFLQTAIHSSMNGMHGLSGWRWLFIIDGVITIPIAIYGFLVFPDLPTTTKAPYLTPSERALAIARMPESSGVHVPLNLAFLKSVLTNWYLYAFVLLWVIAGATEAFSTNALLAMYMQTHPSHRYTVAQMNNYPTGVPAVGIISTMFWAVLTDYVGGKRYLVGFWIGATGIITSCMILTQFGSTATVFAAYYWHGSVYACQATFFAWANDVMRRKDTRMRSVVIACMNTFSTAWNTWWSLYFYSVTDAPKYTKGMWAMIGVSIALLFCTAGIVWKTVHDEGKQVEDEVLAVDADAKIMQERIVEA